jgi:hypothetical protein
LQRAYWVTCFLPLVVGCGGSSFSAATDAAATDGTTGAEASGSLDAMGASDGSDVESEGPTDDATIEAGTDTGADAGADAAADAAGDAAAEAATDAAIEAGGEAGSDAGAAEGGVVDASGGAEACAPITYYADGDGDGYGGTTTVAGCTPPSNGNWVTQGGDCDDSNAQVHPEVMAFYTLGYTPPGATQVSFDYNCDGMETESGTSAKADCAGAGLLNCAAGDGYIQASPARTGVGVDAYCGSGQEVKCAASTLACAAGSPYSAPSSIACH